MFLNPIKHDFKNIPQESCSLGVRTKVQIVRGRYQHTRTTSGDYKLYGNFKSMFFSLQSSYTLFQNGRHFVFFCFHVNWPLWPRSRLNILLNFTFESEAIRSNLHGNKRILKWRSFWNKVYSLLSMVEGGWLKMLRKRKFKELKTADEGKALLENPLQNQHDTSQNGLLIFSHSGKKQG